MPTDNRWISARITKARSDYPIVTEAVSSRMEKLLKGILSERPLSQGKLIEIATTLAADMAPTLPPSPAKQ